MADKPFGIKQLDILGSGTPTIQSANDLNLNANTVAISTNLTVGNKLSISSAGIITASSGVVTYFGDGSNLTGISAGFSPDADENLVAGTNAGANLDGTNACFNILLGFCAGKEITSGTDNVTIGKRSGESTCTGNHNVFIGSAAAYVNTTGSCNVAIGHHALLDNTTASYNTAVGHCAGASVKTSTQNVFLGSCAGKCTGMLVCTAWAYGPMVPELGRGISA